MVSTDLPDVLLILQNTTVHSGNCPLVRSKTAFGAISPSFWVLRQEAAMEASKAAAWISKICGVLGKHLVNGSFYHVSTCGNSGFDRSKQLMTRITTQK